MTAFIVMLLFLLGMVILSYIDEADLKKNGVVVQVTILSVNPGGKSGGGFQCLINYQGESFERPSGTSVKQGRYSFVGKHFPGMYSRNTNTLKILITPEDFEKYNIPFPDSLKWALR